MMTREQIQTERLLRTCQMIAEAKPEQVKRLLEDIRHADGPGKPA